MARRRAISMVVHLSQIAVLLGLVMSALPIVAENTTWTQQAQTYTRHVTTQCNCVALASYLGACEAMRRNKCHITESVEKYYKSFFESENIPVLCLPGYELQGNISPPSKASEPCICLPCNCEVSWLIIAIIASILALFSFLLNVHLLIERKKHRQNDSDEGGTGTSARQAANDINRENGLHEVTSSNGSPMTKIGESNERISLLNSKGGPCDDKSGDNDLAENSQNPPALSNLRRRKPFNYDPSNNTSLGRETEMSPSEHSKKTQSEDRERSLFQKTVRDILDIGRPSLSKFSTEAGTSTELGTLRRKHPFKHDSFSEVMTRARVERQITTESDANESDYTDSENAARCKHEKDSFSSSEFESDDDKPDGSLQKSRLPSESQLRAKPAYHAWRNRVLESLAIKDRKYPDHFSLRGGYGEKTNLNKLGVYLDMPQTQQSKSEGNEDTEISSVTVKNTDDSNIFRRIQTARTRLIRDQNPKKSPSLKELPTIARRRMICYPAASKYTSCASFGPEENIVIKRSMPQTEQRKNEENKKTESPSETSGDSDYEEICSSLSLCQRPEKKASLKQKKGSSSSDNEIRYDGLTNPENSQGSQSNEDRDKLTEKASSRKLERGSTSSDETSDDESHISRARAVTEIYPTHDNASSCARKGIKWNPMLQAPSRDPTHMNMTYMKIKLILLLLFTIFLCCVYFCINSFIDWFIYQIDTYSFGKSVNNFLFDDWV